jgi:hypothetical protein
VLKMRLKATLRNRCVPSVRSRPFLDPFIIHEAFPTLTETALGSHPRCVVSVTYDWTPYFHGANAGSNPAGDAKSISYWRNIYSLFNKKIGNRGFRDLDD